jgi:hypothetical protein
MGFTVSNRITIHGAPEQFKTAVRKSLTFANPKWVENDKRGYWNGKTPKHLKCYEQAEEALKAYFEAPEEGSGGKSKG